MSREVGGDATKKYVNFIADRPCCTIGAVVLAAVIAAPFCLRVGSTTTDSFSAAPHTRSLTETDAIKAQFPSVFDDMETIFVQCERDDCPIEGFQRVFDGFGESLQDYREDNVVVKNTSYFNAPVWLQSQYYNSTANSMLASLELNSAKGDDALDDVVTQMITTATAQSTDGYTVYLSGQIAARLLSAEEVGKVMGMAEGTGMIFIVLLFGWQCRSWRLVFIPLINTVLSLLICQGLVYPLSKSGAIVLPSYVPEVCLFLSIALSVDYSFFHLSRFQEVRKEGMDLHSAVEEMVRTAGRVVLVSGVVLLFTWLALAAFPAFGTDALGYCSAITIFSCIMVNIIMNPAIILAFPNYYGNTAQDPWHCCRRRKFDETSGDAGWEAERPLANPTDDAADAKNCYGSIAATITKGPGMIIAPLLVYAALAPAAVRLFTVEFTTGVDGTSSDTDFASSHILQDFPSSSGGVPLTLLLSPPEGGTIKSDTYFQKGCLLAKAVQEKTGLPPSGFRGVMLSPGSSSISCLSWTDAEQQLQTASSDSAYAWAWGMSVNPTNTSTLISVGLPFDAFGSEAKTLVTTSREGVDAFQSQNKYGTAAAFHPMSIEVDAEDQTIGRLPWVVLVTIIVVFSVIALRYSAALVPLKLLMTIALPIISTLGTTVFVFQDGILNWTGIPSLQSTGGIVWIMPVATTFMLIGFALDYDIFLFSRVYADRKSGLFLEDRPAVIHAVAKTGPVISTAGCIMAFAFSGMVVQHSNSFLSQMGFTMIYGILMDTFVVRTLLVPAFLTMAGSANWWPGVMPNKPLVAATEGPVVLA